MDRKIHSYRVLVESKQSVDAIAEALKDIREKNIEIKLNYPASIISVATTKSAEDVLKVIQKSGNPVEYVSTSFISTSSSADGAIPTKDIIFRDTMQALEDYCLPGEEQRSVEKVDLEELSDKEDKDVKELVDSSKTKN